MSKVKTDNLANMADTQSVAFNQIKAAVDKAAANYSDLSTLDSAATMLATHLFLVNQGANSRKLSFSDLLAAIGAPAIGAQGKLLPLATSVDSLSDLNTIIGEGFYGRLVGGAAGSRNLNHPDGQAALVAGGGVSNFYWLLILKYNSNLIQVAFPYISGADSTIATIKFRMLGGETWSNWRSIWHDGLMPSTVFGRSLINQASATTARAALKVNAPTKQVATTTYTLALDDAESMIEFTSSAAVTVTIPLEATVAWPADTAIHLVQAGIGKVTIQGAAGVTLLKPASAHARTGEQEAVVSIKKRGTNSWRAIGMLEVV